MPEPVNTFKAPDWVPKPVSGMRILVIGATGGLGRALVAMLQAGDVAAIGAHGGTRTFESDEARVIPIVQKLQSEADCISVIERFVEKAGGIDALVEDARLSILPFFGWAVAAAILSLMTLIRMGSLSKEIFNPATA
mgnify:CR=1 FL=1